MEAGRILETLSLSEKDSQQARAGGQGEGVAEAFIDVFRQLLMSDQATGVTNSMGSWEYLPDISVDSEIEAREKLIVEEEVVTEERAESSLEEERQIEDSEVEKAKDSEDAAKAVAVEEEKTELTESTVKVDDSTAVKSEGVEGVAAASDKAVIEIVKEVNEGSEQAVVSSKLTDEAVKHQPKDTAEGKREGMEQQAGLQKDCSTQESVTTDASKAEVRRPEQREVQRPAEAPATTNGQNQEQPDEVLLAVRTEAAAAANNTSLKAENAAVNSSTSSAEMPLNSAYWQTMPTQNSAQQNPFSAEGRLREQQDAVGLNGQNIKEKLTSAKDAKTTERTSSSDVDKNVEKVKEILEKSLQLKSRGAITVRMDPPELGKVTVRVSQSAGRIFARIIPESQDVETALRSRLGDLTSILSASGVRVENIHVSIGHEPSQSENLAFQNFLQGGGSESRGDDSREQGVRQAVVGQMRNEEQGIFKGTEAEGWIA